MIGVFKGTRRASAALLALSLGGCATDLAANPPPSSAALVALADRSAADARRAARPKPVIALPAAAGRVVAIDEADGAEGFRQVVHFQATHLGAGRPGFDDSVALLSGADARTALDATLARKPTEASIKAELDATFPSTAMAVWTKPLANAYGPYGLAVGVADHAKTCAYAWQWIADKTLLERRGLAGPVALRAKFCRVGRGPADFTAWLDQIVIGRDIAGVATLEPGAPAASTRAIHPPRRARRASTQRVPRPAKVAAPDTAGDPTRQDFFASGPRYMAPVAESTFESPPIGSGSSGAGPGVAAPSTDLPPEATRGPPPSTGRTP